MCFFYSESFFYKSPGETEHTDQFDESYTIGKSISSSFITFLLISDAFILVKLFNGLTPFERTAAEISFDLKIPSSKSKSTVSETSVFHSE